MDYYWTTDDLHAGRCTLAQLGEMRPAAEVMDAAVVVLDTSPEAMDRVGTSTLMRLAQQSRDLPTALKAALALLDRTRGRVMPPVQPPASQELPKPEEEWPEWFTSRRLAYQEEQSSESHSGIDSPIGS